MQTTDGSGGDDERNPRVEENALEAEILKLRGRWELASVLNFLDVFKPILDKKMILSAEELEIGLVKPGMALSQLHIQLLKGIPPVSKVLFESDKWVTVLCKKLTSWWPWVVEGKIPLVQSKGEEISKYKELDPTDRLLLLKALCEVRADQHDAVSYINDALKEGIPATSFRKDALGRDGTGISFWYDANAKCQSHRLYKEIITSDSNPKVNGCSSLVDINVQWETLASNHEEFSKAVEKFSCSTSSVEVDIGKKLQSDAIPVLEKLRKKKEIAEKQKQRQDKQLVNDFRNSYCSGNTRSCRLQRPVSYTYEAYDRTINEAIRLTKKRDRSSSVTDNHSKRKISPSTDQNQNRGSEDKSNMMDASTDSDSDRDLQQMSDSDDTVYEIENQDDKDDDDDDSDSEDSKSEEHSSPAVPYPKGVRQSKRIAGVPSYTVLESRGLATKQRLRQRPTRNSAIESISIPDSEDDDEQDKDDLSESE